MGRLTEISPQQNVVNKINAKADFTHNINNTRLERYTVSTQNVLIAANPSLFLKRYMENSRRCIQQRSRITRRLVK